AGPHSGTRCHCCVRRAPRRPHGSLQWPKRQGSFSAPSGRSQSVCCTTSPTNGPRAWWSWRFSLPSTSAPASTRAATSRFMWSGVPSARGPRGRSPAPGVPAKNSRDDGTLASGAKGATTVVMSRRRRWSLLAAVSSALLLIALDNSVLYTALPTLTRELGADGSASLWIVTAYPVVMAGLLLGAGTLGDRVGHVRMFHTGLVIFGAASLVATFAPTAGVLIAARALLAVGAATMMPATLALIR